MKNINRDYIVTVNAKTSTLSANAMSFYITDILTSNIFFQLTFSESGNTLINSYAPNENTDNYRLTLRVVKPNNEPKELNVVLLDQGTNFFIADLTADFIDILGTYECELFIDTEVNGRAERSTTNSFTYVVKPSIFNNLDDIIEGDPDYPLVDNLATKEYVDQVVSGGIDLSGYPTIEEMNAALSQKSDITHQHIVQFVMKDPVNGVLNLKSSYKHIKTTPVNGMRIVLPTTIEGACEIHLYFTVTEPISIVLPNAKYQNVPNLEVGKTYEFIFTYIYAGWVAGVVTYG